jgi:glycosyltransferase involved in cell wall biosynthesis
VSNVLSQTDLEEIMVSESGRHIKQLHRDPDAFYVEYDKKMPDNISIRMYLGQGLELWNPSTINSLGCGGSETWAAMTAKELAGMGCQPLIYAMDSQVWDGVVYRPHSTFRPDAIQSHLFISSRVPEIFNAEIPALQKWLWFHDIHRWDRFTPDIASKIDVLVVLSKWHANFIKATYPFMKDAEVIDFDNNDLTYNDCETQGVWYENEKAQFLPKIAIIGNGIDPTRFDIEEKRIPHRFIWCSSPDRGLKQVLELWPLIIKEWPDADLKIFYGWDYFDSVLAVPSYREYKEKVRALLKQPGVEWCGRVGQEQLVHELKKADIMLYPPPHDFRETFGIAFLEAQAAGVMCYYRMNGALGETIGDRGIPLPLDMTQEEIVKTIISSEADKTQNAIIRLRGVEFARQRTWKRQAEAILQLYRRIDESHNSLEVHSKELS